MPIAKSNKISSQFDYKTISTAIIEKFGSHKECAAALGISEQNLSHKLKRLSNKFIHQLKYIGVKIPDLDYGFTLEVKKEYVKEDQQHYKDCIAEIASLKSELLETKKLLTLSVNRITDLESENQNLRAQVASLLEINRGKGSKINGNQL